MKRAAEEKSFKEIKYNLRGLRSITKTPTCAQSLFFSRFTHTHTRAECTCAYLYTNSFFFYIAVLPLLPTLSCVLSRALSF